MEEPFVLTVDYKGKDRDFDAQLQFTGYTHRFVVVVDEVELYFERDEEGSYRALLSPAVTEKEASRLDRELLQAITSKIEELLA